MPEGLPAHDSASVTVRGLGVAHGGTVVLDNDPGHGATFTLELPTAPAGSAADPVPVVEVGE